jgi:hypothetical protein
MLFGKRMKVGEIWNERYRIIKQELKKEERKRGRENNQKVGKAEMQNK